ncbi:MAG: Capsule synthesis protein CapA [Clostridia bacterium]|jgi:poly-gamma-glutamate synthesis protein (capsule biosynthesis protein)|nr:Capsule synthesis protein CapA [Clostridia bacterium]
MGIKKSAIRGIIGLMFLLSAYNVYPQETKLLQLEEELQEVNIDAPEEENKENVTQINLVSVGDIMMHEEEIISGYHAKTKTYDYHYMFEPIKNYIQNADLAIGNLELTLAGKEKKYTGYPCFNAPDELALALKDTGFDILTTANNHSLDRRFYGIKRTIQVLDKLQILHTGTFITSKESNEMLISEVNGTKIAFLAYTYGTNGISFDKGKEFSVNLINKNKMMNDIAKAKQLEAELICVSIHFGDEYVREPNNKQKEIVNFIASQGADIILGSHPHVLQPIEIRKIKKNDEEKEVVILYSQGNFISAQRDRYQDASALFNIELEKNCDTNHISIKSVTYIPTWVDLSRINGQYHFRVLPAKKYIHVFEAKKDALISQKDYNILKRSLKDVRQILMSNDTRIHEQLTLLDE